MQVIGAFIDIADGQQCGPALVHDLDACGKQRRRIERPNDLINASTGGVRGDQALPCLDQRRAAEAIDG